MSHVKFPSDIQGKPELEHSFVNMRIIVHSSQACCED